MSAQAPARPCFICTGTSSAAALRRSRRCRLSLRRRRSPMNLIPELEQEVKEAVLARDAARRDALRLILSSLTSAEKELQRPLSEAEELQVLQRERKKRLEAAQAFRDAGREE